MTIKQGAMKLMPRYEPDGIWNRDWEDKVIEEQLRALGKVLF